MIGPMIGNHSSTPAIRASTSVNWPNSEKPMRVRIVRPIAVARKIDAPEEELPADPPAADATEQGQHVLRVRTPAGRHRRGDGPAEPFAVLQDEEQPDRDDDESEQEGGRPDDGVDRRREQAGDDRCDDVARRGDLRVDRFADVRRQREALVPLDDRALDIADGRPELGQLIHELVGLPGDRGHHEVEQRPDHGDRGGIEDDHAAPSAARRGARARSRPGRARTPAPGR